jgi:enterochelin esterase-like enzyme
MSKRSVMPGLALLPTLLLAGCLRLHKEPFEKIPISPGQLQAERVSEQSQFTVERVRFYSEALKEPRFFLAMVPHSQPTDVFILNHGWADRPEYLLKHLKVNEVYDELLARNELRQAVVIMPDVRFRFVRLSERRRIPFPPYLNLIAEEIPELVSQRYHVPLDRQHWAVGGFSFGGYLSLDVARHYPGRFGSVSIISGFADPHWSLWPDQSVQPVVQRDRDQNTVVVPGSRPALFLACGSDDRLFPSMQNLHEELAALGVPHEWHTSIGAHTWKYWRSVLAPMFEFHLAKVEDGKVQ